MATDFEDDGGLPPFRELGASLPAAVSMLEAAATQRRSIYRYLVARSALGATGGEIEAALHMRGRSVSARLWELAGNGKDGKRWPRVQLIGRNGEKRTNESGRSAWVWVVLNMADELPPVPPAGPPPAVPPPRHDGDPFYCTAEGRAMRERVLRRARNRCEGSHAFPGCRVLNGVRHPVTGSVVVLTTAHVDQDDANSDPANLRAWCQRCHLHHDRHQHQVNRQRTAVEGREAEGQQRLFGGDDAR